MLNILTSLVALSAIFVPDSVPPFQRMVIYMATSMVCKMSVSTSLSIFITSMSEIVTKDKRKICNYSGVTCSRTLVMIAPFIGFCVIFGQLGEINLSRNFIYLISVFRSSPNNHGVFEHFRRDTGSHLHHYAKNTTEKGKVLSK